MMLTNKRFWWVIVVVFWIIADLATTFVGLNIGLIETNPIAATILVENGFIGLIGFKLFSMLIIYGIYCTTPKKFKIVVLIETAIGGIVITLSNIYYIIGAL